MFGSPQRKQKKVAACIEVLRHADGSPKRKALKKLARYGPAAASAVPWILEDLNSSRTSSADLTSTALATLSAIGLEAESALDVLGSLMQSGTPHRRAEVIETIGTIGIYPHTVSKKVRMLLTQYLEEEVLRIRIACCSALSDMRYDDQSSRRPTIVALDWRADRKRLLKFASVLPPTIDNPVPFIFSALRSAPPAYSNALPHAILASFSSELDEHHVAPLVDAVEKTLIPHYPDGPAFYEGTKLGLRVRQACENAVHALVILSPLLAKSAQHKIANVFLAKADAETLAGLSALFETSEFVVPELTGLLENGLANLENITTCGADLMRDERWRECLAAVNTLGRFGTRSRGAEPLIVKFLRWKRDAPPYPRELLKTADCLCALAQISPRAVAVDGARHLEALVAEVRDEVDKELRGVSVCEQLIEKALLLFGHMHKEASCYRDLVERATCVTNLTIRKEARKALARMGEEQRSLLCVSCAKCLRRYKLGIDASVVTAERVAADFKVVTVLGSKELKGGTEGNPDLVAACVPEWVPGVEVEQEVRHLKELIAEGVCRYWRCEACQTINRYT